MWIRVIYTWNHLARAIVLAAVAVIASLQPARADEAIARYFDQLRGRGLFSLAESYAMTRLTQPNLPRPRRVQFVTEFSRTLAQHAENVSEQQQQELWTQAKTVVEDERARQPNSPFDLILAGQSAMVLAGQAEWLRFECQLRPFDESLHSGTRQQCSSAIEQLAALERILVSPPKDSTNKNDSAPAPSTHELRVLMHRVRLALAKTLRNRAELTAADSRQRNVDLIDAEQWARKLIGNADEPIATRAKLMLAVCTRIKGEKGGLDRADEMLASLEKSVPTPDNGLNDEIAVQRLQILLDRHQAPDALKRILQIQSAQKRLTGELWFLRTQALVSMREVAVARMNSELATKLSDEAEITLQRCDEQLGGFWSRRCRQLWDNVQNSEKHGPELDSIMQQARADFLANRIEAALNSYSRGERLARTSGQTEMAFELGYTRASILLREKQYEAGSAEFLRLASEYSQHGKAAAAHLNGAYCLGRMYDEQKTQSRREAYTNALDEQMERFAGDPTSDDARFFKARLEEQRLQATAALPLYLKVDKDHARGPEARAGAARCYETILNRMRDKKLPTGEFQRAALESIGQFVASADADESKWKSPQCEAALHLAAIVLMVEPPDFQRAERLLSRIIQNATRVAADDEQIERWKQLRQRAEALRVVALAGRGQPGEAERMIDSLGAASPRDLAVVVERLVSLVDTSDRQRRIQYVNLLLRAADQLGKHGNSLSKDERDHLDQSLGKAYLASGQLSKAVEIYQRQAAAAAKDSARLREIAMLLDSYDQRDFKMLARQCWRRIEALTTPESAEWLTARLGVLSTTVQLNELTEARKLLGITKLLCPELGGPEMQARFAAIEKSLQTGAAAPEPK